MCNTLALIVPAAAVATLLALGSVPAAAQDIVVQGPPSFRDLEYHYSGAESIPVARAALQAQIPAGTPIADARATLRKAGAHCPLVAGNGDLHCTYNSFAGLDDHLQDISWMIDVRSQNGRTTDLAVDRITLGN